MLKIVILVVLFLLIFFVIYKNMKRIAMFWTKEFCEKDSLKDIADKLQIERKQFNEDLKEAEKNLKDREKEIKNIKKKGF